MKYSIKNDLQTTLYEENKFVVCVDISENRVKDAWVTGKMISVMDLLFGVTNLSNAISNIEHEYSLCSSGHVLAATRALEQAIGLEIPKSIRLLRNIVHCLQSLIDHLTSFYLFYVNDWINVGRALRASPDATAQYARAVNAHLPAENRFYQEALQRLAAQATGEGGKFFSVGNSDHPAYIASPEACLLILSHIPNAVAVRAQLSRIQGILRGVMATDPIWNIGEPGRIDGVAAKSSSDLALSVREQCSAALRECRQFMLEIFLPDALLLGEIYRDWDVAGQTDAFLCWGEFPGSDGDAPFYPCGVFTAQEAGRRQTADPKLVSEEKEPAWTARDAEHYRLRFGTERSVYQWSNEDFHWIGVLRHAGRACEVGPLARLIGAYAQGNPVIRPLVDGALKKLRLPLAGLNSTIGRVVARGLEAAACVQAAETWLQDLDQCLEQENTVSQGAWDMPENGEGFGTAELARGALVHHIRFENRRIVLHETFVPSLWNFSPRSSDGTPGPLEQALQATAVANPANPLELIRVIHAFDPCNACVLHIEDHDAGRVLSRDVK